MRVLASLLVLYPFLKACVDVDTISVLALNGHMPLIKCRADRTIIHYFLNNAERSSDSVQYCVSAAWTAVVVEQ